MAANDPIGDDVTTETELLGQIARADQAKRIMAEPLIAEAFRVMEQDIIGMWESCPARDAEGKEDLWKLYRLCKKLRGTFEGYVQGGKMARIELDRLEGLADKMKRMWRA